MSDYGEESPTTSEWEDLHNVDTSKESSSGLSSEENIIQNPSSLQELCAYQICIKINSLSCIDCLPLPKKIRDMLREYY